MSKSVWVPGRLSARERSKTAGECTLAETHSPHAPVVFGLRGRAAGTVTATVGDAAFGRNSEAALSPAVSSNSSSRRVSGTSSTQDASPGQQHSSTCGELPAITAAKAIVPVAKRGEQLAAPVQGAKAIIQAFRRSFNGPNLPPPSLPREQSTSSAVQPAPQSSLQQRRQSALGAVGGLAGAVRVKRIRSPTNQRSLELPTVSAGNSPRNSAAIPNEILARGERAQRKFREALEKGRQQPRTLKVMFVGCGRAGKTSTLKSLCGESFDLSEASTHGMAQGVCEATVRHIEVVTADDMLVNGASDSRRRSSSGLASSQWKRLEPMRNTAFVDGLFDSAIARHVATELLRPPTRCDHDESDLEVSDEGPASARLPAGSGILPPGGWQRVIRPWSANTGGGGSPAENGNGDLAAGPHCVSEGLPIFKMPINLVIEHMEDDQKHEAITLQTFDFGGQEEYYVMHHLFMSNKGLYVVVFDLSLWLKSAAGKRLDENVEDRALTYWLCSVVCHAPESKVLMVGTHVDMLGEQKSIVLKEVETHLQELLERTPALNVQLVINTAQELCFFPVDNRRKARHGIEDLRLRLQNSAYEICTTGFLSKALPIYWLKFQTELLRLAYEGPERFWATDKVATYPVHKRATHVLPFSQVGRLARAVGILDDVELLSALIFLHDTGSVIFFDEANLRDYVVLDPHWLAEAAANIFNCPRVVQGNVSAARRLLERGQLQVDFLRNHLWKAPRFAWHVPELLLLLVRFNLLVVSPASDVYIVPARLPLKTGAYKPVCTGSLSFDFHGMLTRLLPTVFPRIIASAAKSDTLRLTYSQVYRDSATLYLGNHRLALELVPPTRPEMIAIRPLGFSSEDAGNDAADADRAAGNSTENSDGSPHEELPLQLARQLIDLVHSSTAEWLPHLSFTAGILCPLCQLAGKPHIIDIDDFGEEVLVCRKTHEPVSLKCASWALEWRSEALAETHAGSPQRRSSNRDGNANTAPLSPNAAGGRCAPNVVVVPPVCQSANSVHHGADDNCGVRLPGTPLTLPTITPVLNGQSPASPVALDAFASNPSTAPASPSDVRHAFDDEAETCAAIRASALRGRIYFLYASPINHDALDVRSELGLLLEAIQLGKKGRSAQDKRFDLEVDVRLGSAQNLLELLSHGDADNEGLPIFLHCTMHAGVAVYAGTTDTTDDRVNPRAGLMESFLVLEDESGRSQNLSKKRLMAWLRQGNEGKRCPISAVFLNSCDSEEIASAFVEVGVPHVVCCRGKVFDSACRTFTRAFYRSFSSGKSVLTAFEYARESVGCAPQAGLRAEAEKFYLLPARERGSQASADEPDMLLVRSRHHLANMRELTGCPDLAEDAPRCANHAAAACRWMAPVSSAGTGKVVLPVRSQHFLGREKEMIDLGNHLARGGERGARIVNVWGKTPGLGKSALLADFLRFFICPGRLFAGAGIWISLRCPTEEPSALPITPHLGDAPPPLRLERNLSGHANRGPLFLAQLYGAVYEFGVAFEKDLEMPPHNPSVELLSMALRKFEQQGRVLMVLDGIHNWVDSAEVRMILAEVLQSTERLCLVFGSRIHIQTSFGGLKTDNLELNPLDTKNSAQLFLYRVHRHICWKDLWRTREEWFEQAASLCRTGSLDNVSDRSLLDKGDVPIALDRVNHVHFLEALARMPVLSEFCQGVPLRIQETAERVTSSCACLWDLLEELRLEHDRDKRDIQDRIMGSPAKACPRSSTQRRNRAGGSWQLGNVLGQGSQGVVHKALDLSRGESFAVKVVEDNPQLRHELQIFQNIDHEHIVSYQGHEVHGKQLYIFLEFMPEGTVRDKLIEFGPFQEHLCCALCRQLLSGLEYLHAQRVIHRDLKCSNLLLDVSGCVKISDFGCSRWISSGSQAKTFAGSPLWLPPEMLVGQYDFSADIWSFGCTVLELLTAKPPWHDQIHADNGVAAAIQIQQCTQRGEVPRAGLFETTMSAVYKDFVWNGTLRVEPELRLGSSELLAHAWIAQPDFLNR